MHHLHLGNRFTIIRRPVGAGETETGNRPESTDSQSENDIVTPEALHRFIDVKIIINTNRKK